jgi:hypothetical protein
MTINSRKIPLGFAGSNFRPWEYKVAGFRMLANEYGRASSTTSTTLVDTSKSWAVDAYKDKYVVVGSSVGPQTVKIVSNTSNTLTVASWPVALPTSAIMSDGSKLIYEIQNGAKIMATATSSTGTSVTVSPIAPNTSLNLISGKSYTVVGQGIPVYYTGSSVTPPVILNSKGQSMTHSASTVSLIKYTPTTSNPSTITLPIAPLTPLNGIVLYFFENELSIECQLMLMANSGVESFRTPLFWKDIEPNAPIGETRSYKFSPANDGVDYDIFYSMSASLGMNAMIRLGNPPDHEIDYPYSKNYFGPVSLDVTGYGGQFITVKTAIDGSYDHNLNNSYAVFKNMFVTGTNVPANTYTTPLTENQVTLGTTTYNIVVNKNTPETSVRTGVASDGSTAYIIKLNNNVPSGDVTISATIKVDGNLVTSPFPYYNTDSSNPINFSSENDLRAFCLQMGRKGGTVPKNFKNFGDFMNVLINRYGANGTIWQSENNLWSRPIQKTLSDAHSGSLTSGSFKLISNIADCKGFVVGATIESSASGSIPATSTNGNAAFLSPKTKILSIAKDTSYTTQNAIYLSKFTNTASASNQSITIKYPPIQNWQIYNEVPSDGADGTFYWRINSGTIHSSNILIGVNWPQYRTTASVVNSSNNTSSVYTTNMENGWGPSFSSLLSTAKAEAHSTDPNASIVTSGINSEPSSSNTASLFTKKNAKNSFDKIAFHLYGPYTTSAGAVNSGPYTVTGQETQRIITLLEKNYGKNTPSYNITPDVIISEYGWSTAPKTAGSVPAGGNGYSYNVHDQFIANATPNSLGYITTMFDKNWHTINHKIYTARKMMSENTNLINFESVMYFKWASDEGREINDSPFLDNWRGPNFYMSPSTNSSVPGSTIQFYMKPAAKSLQDAALTLQGRI